MLNFKKYEGHFWGLTETRPYMDAKFHLAHVLWKLGEREKAITHLKEMLRLNPNDNQGVRYILINWLIEENDKEYIKKLLKEYEDDAATDFQYGAALFYFTQQDMLKAVEHLHEAMKRNPHVPFYLLGYKRIPKRLPDYTGLGDESEAQVYAAHAGKLWQVTLGALDWLKHNLPYQLGF